MWPPAIISDLYTVAVFFTNLLLLKLALLSRHETRTKPITTARQFVDDTCPSSTWVGLPSSSPECSVCLSDFVAGEEVKCSVCLADFAKGDAVRKLRCGHCFHRSCVDRWFEELGKSSKKGGGGGGSFVVMTCPLCRSGVVSPPGGGGERRLREEEDDRQEWGQRQLVVLLSSLRGDDINNN
ncbi:E3 ubiquitin-protein ligase RHA1B [Linum perenne]